ncbi:MAG: glycosyl hydrolase [Acidobacteria bacterium]|nr:glycosyl hydrolase [Acidobacteriota bacterium]
MRRSVSRRTFAAACLVGFAVLALGVQPFAQAPPPANGSPGTLFSSLKWRAIGPNRGGRSVAVAGSASRPFEYYFGATGGGVWKTSDGGTTWRPVTDKFLKTSSVGALAVSESNPDIVYAGMGETELRGNIIQGDGVYKSTDAGKTWTSVGLTDTQAISRIRVHPKNPDLVYVAALGKPYAPGPERGVFRSKDGGKTWERILFHDPKSGVVDLSMDPNNPDVLYAAMWEVFRTPHSLSSGGPGSGLLKSTDGGTTWTELTRNPGLPAGIWGKVGVAVSPVDGKRVFAIIESENGGVFRSDDAGATWTQVNGERRLRQRAFYYSRIYADPGDRDTMYVLNTGFYRSTDAGKTYTAIRVPHGDNHDLWIAPNDARRMVNSNDGGANVSVNSGETWTPQTFPTAQLYNAFITTDVPYHVCGAQQDNSTACMDSRGNGSEFYDVGGGESGYIAPDPRNPDIFYAGSYGGHLTRHDRKSGQERAINVWPDNPMGYSAIDITERFQWTYPIVFSPADPKVLYVGSQHVWKTTNEGQSWERISPDLTRHDPTTMGPSGGPITLDQTGVETYATVFTIAPSRHDVNVIWTGSDDGYVQLTQDGGKTWSNVTPPALPAFARISLVEASPHKPGTALVAANRYQRDDRAPYVFRTDDFGKTWAKIVTGIPADDFARTIREDIKKPGLLYLGTEHGLYVSFDNGAAWQSLRLDLPVTPVHGIVSTENDLVIGTHGRSFYILDNAAILRQFAPGLTDADVHLFDPPAAIRGISRGVSIDYFLKSQADKMTIEILDAQGQVVNTYAGTTEKDAAKPEAAPAGDEEGPRRQAPRVATKAGMNRFVWDMRYANAKDFPGMILWAGSTRGPVAVPGTYQIRLTAGGVAKTVGFTIRKNPNLTTISQGDLQDQFTLALQIRDKVTQADEAVIRIRDLKKQIADRVATVRSKEKGRQSSDVVIGGESLGLKLTMVEGEIYQYRNQSSQDPLNFPIKLNNKLAALQGVVESGDGKPTEQAYAVFKDLSTRLDEQLAKLAAIVKTDIAAFNKELQKKRLDAIK